VLFLFNAVLRVAQLVKKIMLKEASLLFGVTTDQIEFKDRLW